MRMAGRTMALAVALLTLVACGNDRPPRLMNLTSSTNGPDEFGILPPKALELPESLTDLPEPTPGGSNLTDPTPNEDAITALGGRPGGRHGRAAGIREQLAAEDLAFRSKNRGKPLQRLFNLNVYFGAYKKQSLDQYAELERWRRAGARNPSAPPPGLKK
jgi:hypothetical protein